MIPFTLFIGVLGIVVVTTATDKDNQTVGLLLCVLGLILTIWRSK